MLIPIVTGGALGAYNPRVGLAVGGLTLGSAAVFKKGWAWWLVGCVVLVLALFFYWKDQQDQKEPPRKQHESRVARNGAPSGGFSGPHQLAFDSRKRLSEGMNRYNELKLLVFTLFAATQGEWLGPNEAAGKLDFFPPRST